VARLPIVVRPENSLARANRDHTGQEVVAANRNRRIRGSRARRDERKRHSHRHQPEVSHRANFEVAS